VRTTAIILFSFLSYGLFAQSTTRFKTVGSAVYLSDSCFRLTAAISFQSGSVWYDTRLDLRQDFSFECEINLGGIDEMGADGIAFVLQPLSSDTGSAGQGIGYGGIAPSIAIEFDTWQNAADPAYDHIALVRDGQATHSSGTTLVGPIEMLPGGANAEDRVSRPARFIWDATNKRLSCYYDGVLKFEINIDLIKDIFQGNPYVYWGFTAATGGQWNDQRVCFSKIKFVEECPTAKIIAKNPVCLGDTLIMKATGGKTFNWTGPGNFKSTDSVITIFNASNSTAGLYLLTAVDSVCIDTATIDIVVKSRTIAAITSNAPLCEGDSLVLTGSGGINYLWKGPNNFSSSSSLVGIPNVSVAYSGQFRLIVDNGACKDTAFTNVLINAGPKISSKDTLVEAGTVLDLALVSSADVKSWLWTPPEQLSCTTCPVPTANLLRDGTYIATVSNASGCNAKGNYAILFKCDLKNIFIPNAFTPNGDGLNDYFYPMGSGIRQVISMKVFSRWGDLVYEKKNFPANDRSYGWDGKIKSNILSSNIYTYTITLECSEGQIVDRKGSISLIR
jgi:gliding motility-associated-like protein